MITEKVFVLRAIKHQESDIILHCLSSSGSKLNLFARAALKSRRRFGGGVLEPTHYLQVTYKPPKEIGQLGTLYEASLIHSFNRLRTDLERLELGLYFVSLVDKVSREGDPHSGALFHLLGNALSSAQETRTLDKLRTQFELKLLESQGVLPPIPFAEVLLQTSLRHHESLLLQEAQWHTVKSRVFEVLSQYLS